MIGDLSVKALAENSQRDSIQKRALINLNSEPLKDGDFPTAQGDLRLTDLMYYVKYLPSQLKQYYTRPFIIVGDLFPGRKIRTTSYDYTKLIANDSKVVKWIIENSDLSQAHFDEARANIQMAIPFYVDPVKYAKKLREKKGEPDSKYSMFREPIVAKADRMRYEKFLYDYRHNKGRKVV